MFKNRPADNRPRTNKTRNSRAAVPTGDVRPLFAELLSYRTPSEALRSSDGSFFERAVLIDRLGELRPDPTRIRRNRR